MPLRIDLHVHTHYSYDGLITPKELVFYSKKAGLDGVAVTDHDTLRGALKLMRQREVMVIPGMEISAVGMHVLALNVTSPIPPELGVQETIDRIHEAGGIAVASHPTAILKGNLRMLTAKFDAIEVMNSSAFPFLFAMWFNRRLAKSLGLPQTAGSDAHYGPEIGSAYTIVDVDLDVEKVVEAVREGRAVPCGRHIPWSIRLKREALVFKKKNSGFRSSPAGTG